MFFKGRKCPVSGVTAACSSGRRRPSRLFCMAAQNRSGGLRAGMNKSSGYSHGLRVKPAMGEGSTTAIIIATSTVT